jgi:hypothetical protein
MHKGKLNNFNKKTLIFFSLSSLMFTGCIAKNEVYKKQVQVHKVKTKTLWNKSVFSKVKKDDCIDCVATPIATASSIDYSKPPSRANNLFAKVINKPLKTAYKQDKVIDSKNYGAYDYTETASDTAVKRSTYVRNKHIAPAVSYENTSYGRYSAKGNIAIQVGAFSQYDGAKTYKKRYSALSSKYQVTIQTGTKNNKSLHRVRIEGFKNKAEAKKFMYSYAIRDAFVVIR